MDKQCTGCGKLKQAEEFGRDTRVKCGSRARCKECRSAEGAEYRTRNAENIKKAYCVRKEKDPEGLREEWSRWRANNTAKNRENVRLWEKKNPEKAKAKRKRYVAAHPERVRENSRRGSCKARSKPGGNLRNSVTVAIWKSLRGTKGGRHWEALVGFTIDQLRAHLEKLFQPNMSWDNYGTLWEIDHKMPVAVFNFERPEDIDFRICWSLKNLQPLSVKENRRKNKKIDRPFQPSLALG
jgi:hypothetical protein